MKAGRFRITISREQIERELGKIGDPLGPKIENIFAYCYNKIRELRKDDRVHQQNSYGITFSGATEAQPAGSLDNKGVRKGRKR